MTNQSSPDINPDDDAADGVAVWMVVGEELRTKPQIHCAVDNQREKAMDGLSRSIERLRNIAGFDGPPCLTISELDLMEARLAALRTLDVAQAVPDPEASIPTYGSIPWDQLGRDVVEAQIGTRRDFEYDPKFYPGHQMVSINFNSLARIVDKYRLASAISSTEGK